jgi:hypothetical protein
MQQAVHLPLFFRLLASALLALGLLLRLAR